MQLLAAALNGKCPVEELGSLIKCAALGKDHTITDDQIKRGQDQVQKLTDKYIKQIEDLVGGKEKEIMEV